MYTIKQSTAQTIPIFVHDASGDAVTGLVDAGFTKRISKGSGAFAAMTVTITEKENGWYDVPLSTAHTDTLGILSITFTHASSKQVNLQFRVEAKLVDNLNDFNATTDTVANVTLVATTTTNTDMRGTDNAALASVCTEARLSELDEATPGKMANQVDEIRVDTENVQSRLPAALDGGRMDSSVGAYQSGLQPFDITRSGALNGTYGQTIKLLHEWVGNQYAVDDVTPATTEFDTTFPNIDLTGMTVGFVNGSANGTLSRVVESSAWTGTHLRLTFNATEAFPVTPVNGDNIVLNVAAGFNHTLTTLANNIENNTSVGDLADGGRTDLLIDSIISDKASQASVDIVDGLIDNLINGVLKKNTVGTFPAKLVDAAGDPVASQAVTVYVTKDATAEALATGTATTTDANGRTLVSYSAADVNCDAVTFRLVATGAQDTTLDFKVS